MTRKHVGTAAGVLAAAIGVGAALTLQNKPKVGGAPDVRAIIQKLPPGSVYDVPPGSYAGDLVLRNPQRLTLRATRGTVTFAGGSNYCLKCDGGRDVTFTGLEFRNSRGYGCMAVNVDGLTVDNCAADNNRLSGILTGDCRRVTVTNCEAKGNIQEHGVYLSQKGDTYRVEGNVLTGNGRTGVQVNAHPGGAAGVRVVGNDVRDNPTAGVQLAAVKGALVARNTVGSNRAAVVVWDDGQGTAWASSDVDLTGQSGPFNVAANSRNVRLPKTVGTAGGR